MPELLIPLRLGPKQIDQAFPIVQSLMPRLGIDDWRSFAATLCRQPAGQAGIMTVQSQGYIHGLFSYAVERHLVHHRVLRVDNIVVLDLFTPGTIAEALLQALDQLAVDLDCRGIQAMLPDGPQFGGEYRNWLEARFRSHGHRIGAVMLCKPVAIVAESDPQAGEGQAPEKVPACIGPAE